MNKAIFLDRDGTINIDYGYVYKRSDLMLIEGVISALKRLTKAGFLLIIITNQSGVGRNLFTLKSAETFNNHLVKKLRQEGIIISDVFMCPHSPIENCECRKPSPKLVLDAIMKFNIEKDKSFFIGDKNSDVECGNNAGIQSFKITNEYDINYWTNIILNKNGKAF
jgi:D-glycero-D-manno-heptose 1,7-bisphosphate phosphatase